MSMTPSQWLALFSQEHNRSDERAWYQRQAIRKFWQAYSRGKRRTWFKSLAGGNFQLQDMSEAFKGVTVKSRHHLGRQSVPIDRIRGSEGRSREFDDEFNPLALHTMDRWIDIAIAQHMGSALPPVDLIQVGEVFFVRDGHHRVSVARSNDQEEIDAEVTLWEL